MRAKPALILVGISAILGWALISWSSAQLSDQEACEPFHAEGPSLKCFSCHGPHPSPRVKEVDLSRFTVPPHLSSEGPALTCAECHTYPEELESVTPNSCVGCHERGGYSLKAALSALAEEGHPDVLSFVNTVPDDCFMCHQGELRLGPRLHRRHLIESQMFTLHFQSSCSRCHVVGEDGEATIVSQPLKR